MKLSRRTMLTGSGAAMAAAATAGAQPSENPLAAFILPDGDSIKAVRVVAGRFGQAEIADAVLAADTSPYPLFKQFLTHQARAAAIYRAPPNHKVVTDQDAGKLLLFIVDGETTLKAGNSARRCHAGTVILLDAGCGGGLGEQAGPAGYTAIKVQLAD